MSGSQTEGAALTKEGLFRMFAEEACRDGVLEEFEANILLNVARFLRLEKDEAQRILSESKDRYEKGLLGEQRPLEPRCLYQRALAAVYADGKVDHLEEQMLAGLRKMFNITLEEHEGFLKSIGSISAAPEPPVPQHQPGSTTEHLARRLEFNQQKAWFKDQCNWHAPLQRASDEAKQAWRRFLDGLLQSDENEVYNALDAIDDILNQLNSISMPDVLLALGALRWSRVLLKTRFADDDSMSARTWPGADIYNRLCIKMGPILISIDHLRIREGLEEYGSMAFVHLLEDLCMLIERRHAEPMMGLQELLRMLFRVVTKSSVTHLAAELIKPLAAQAHNQGGAVLDNFIEVCLAICDIQPQNHPLVIEANQAILKIAPEKSRFPKDYQPTNRPSCKPGYETAVHRLERLIDEVNQKQENERSLVAALANADLSAIDTITQEVCQVCNNKGLDPQMLLDQYLVAMILPELSGYQRPVIAFFALGNSEGHHEELKGGWIDVLLKPLEQNRLQVIPDFPMFSSTEFLSISSHEAEIKKLKESLHRSGGAYDIALVDPGRKSARIWQQVGDLDPTGTLYRVDRELLPAKNDAEALQSLDNAFAGQPWLSRAMIRKGLIAKRSGDMEAARKAFEKAVEVQPHDPHALTRLGVLDKNETRMESCEELLLKSLKILPTQPSAIVTLGSNMLGKLAGEDSSALPFWDYYIAGLNAFQENGEDFKQIADVSNSFDRTLARNAITIPVDTIFYL
ncbi:MAG: hypothetical protein KKB51_00730 [Candidatus Riflebacteria bacterium]|nr:hypothetical protein [Candidatus Riflebacteria bacterium]